MNFQHLKQYFETTTNRLIAVNILVFVLIELFYTNRWSGFELFPWGSAPFQYTQLISYMFLHGGLAHLLFNMFALWSFGRLLEHIWGPQRFLIFYIACGIGAGIAHLVVGQLSAEISVAIGASGAVYGVLIASAWMYPNSKIMLIFLPVPIAAKYFVPVLLLIDLSAGITGVSLLGQNIAHFAHLGGALTGFLLLQLWLSPRR